MYPDLSYFMHDVFGTRPDNIFSLVKTFGFFLVMAFLTAAFFLHKEMVRKEKQGLLKPIEITTITGKGVNWMDVIMSSLFGFLLGYKALHLILNFSEFLARPNDVLISKEGNIIGGILGAILYGGYKYWEGNKNKLDHPKEVKELVFPSERVGDLTMVAAISGIVGAKIFAIVEDLPSFFADPIGTFFSGAGMAIYGGLLVGATVCYFYLKSRKIAPIHIMDAVAPSLILSYGVGRLGCQFSGDGDWGIPNTLDKPGWMSFLPDWMWSYDFPHNVLKQGIKMDGCEWEYCYRLAEGRFPTSTYEMIFATLIFLFLWSIRKKIVIPGMLFFIYVIFNGFERFWIEKIRVNDKYDIFGIPTTQAEFIAVMLMVLGVIGVVYLKMTSKDKIVPTA